MSTPEIAAVIAIEHDRIGTMIRCDEGPLWLESGPQRSAREATFRPATFHRVVCLAALIAGRLRSGPPLSGPRQSLLRVESGRSRAKLAA